MYFRKSKRKTLRILLFLYRRFTGKQIQAFSGEEEDSGRKCLCYFDMIIWDYDDDDICVSLPSNHFFVVVENVDQSCHPLEDEKLCSLRLYFWYLCLIWGHIGSWGGFLSVILVSVNVICFCNTQMGQENNVPKPIINCANFYSPVQDYFTSFKIFLIVKLQFLEGNSNLQLSWSILLFCG